MGPTIFYSWQTDSPDKTNKRFIREALNDAVALVNAEATIEDSPRVDSGMEGISGSPEVATIMFRKIDKCAVFVGDVTLVGSIPPAEEGGNPKRAANPNVLLEMGYAAARIGWDRVICVMNEHFGTTEQQAFDVRNRRFPIDYSLGPDDSARREREKRDLTRTLKGAIEAVFANEHLAVEDTVARLDVHCLHIIHDYRCRDWFPHLPVEHAIAGHQLAYDVFTRATARLLDLGILRCNAPRGSDRYAYHWTYLGKLVLDRVSPV